jgi:hypothetical protein
MALPLKISVIVCAHNEARCLLVRSEKSWPAVRPALRSNVDVALTLSATVPGRRRCEPLLYGHT